MAEDFTTRIKTLAAENPQFSPDAFTFVAEAVNYSVGKLKRPRHVSGAELIAGVREYARQQYGSLGSLLLESWGIDSCQAVGKVVFLMIDAKLLSASPEDEPEDFDLASPLFPVVEPNRDKLPPLPLIDER